MSKERYWNKTDSALRDELREYIIEFGHREHINDSLMEPWDQPERVKRAMELYHDMTLGGFSTSDLMMEELNEHS